MTEQVHTGPADNSLLKSFKEEVAKYMRVTGTGVRFNGVSQDGFSLIEMIMVIMFIMTMCAVALPFLSGFIENRDLKTAAETLASDIYATKEASLSSGNVYTLVFNVNGNSYAISQCDSNGNNCVARSTGSPASIRKTIVIDTAVPPAFLSTPLQITFEPRGSVNSGTVHLINSRGSKATINVSITGRTSVNWDTLK
jgi:Tfp pilus assembly protein FimT